MPHRPLAVLSLLLMACSSPTPSDASSSATEQGGSDSDTTGPLPGSTGETGSETGSTSETGETGTETETGEPCTGEICSSTLRFEFAHTLALLDGPHRFLITLPTMDLICSIPAELSGQKSCFGFAFADSSWTESQVTVVLTNPFFDTELNPDAEPFTSAMVRVERDVELIYEAEIPIVPGEAMMPDPCGLTCWQALAQATIE